MNHWISKMAKRELLIRIKAGSGIRLLAPWIGRVGAAADLEYEVQKQCQQKNQEC